MVHGDCVTPSMMIMIARRDPHQDIMLGFWGQKMRCSYVLQQTDYKGRLVLYFDAGKIDVEQCSALDLLKIRNMYYETLSCDERSQINGIVQYMDTCKN
uniref:CRAL-TRIO domain-containing protein n=1 Tax=Phlebotomus papatasi TaxID=29031 RepID=A0A1B0GN44_PHLPP